MSKIKLVLPEGQTLSTGMLLSFVAPCACADTTALNINGIDYSLVDAMGNIVSGAANSWRVGALLSVLIDVSGKRAFMLNSTHMYCVTPIENGGTGANTVAGARNALGLGNTAGALPIANGGTGASTVAAARNALGLGNTAGALPVANGGTGATDVAGALANLGLTKHYASANGSSSSLSLPKAAITQLTLDSWKVRSDDSFTFKNGGIEMPMAGTVLICAGIYFTSPTTSTPGNVGPYIRKNGTEIAGQMSYSQVSTVTQISPFIAEVAKGDVITLCGRSGTSDGTCAPSGGATALTIIYL